MDKKTITIVVAVLAIVGALTSIYFTQFKGAGKPNMKPWVALGEIGAEEVAKIIPSGSVVVITGDVTKNITQETQFKALQAGLKKKGITIAKTEAIQTSPMMMMDPSMGLNAEQFAKIIEGSGSAAGVVSLIGFPPLTEADLGGKKDVKLILLGGFSGGPAKKMLEDKILSIAIVPKPNSQGAAGAKSNRELFDRLYMVVTPETAGDLPY